MHEVANGVMTGILGFIAYQDWKTRKISVALLSMLSVSAFLFQIFIVREELWSVLGGMMVGCLFFVASACTKEAVGYGDSWLITILGFYLGGTKILEVMLAAGMGASIFAVWKLWQKGWSKKITLPFAPFVMAAYVGAVYL